jgi:hypothetical protein
LRRSSCDVGAMIKSARNFRQEECDSTYLTIVLVVPGAVETIVVLVVMVDGL